MNGAKLTKKQKEMLDSFLNENPKITVASGGKRGGKTFVLIILYLMHIARFENKGLSFIIGGVTMGSIQRNVLDDMEGLLGKELKPNKQGYVTIFGNKVYCFDGAKSDSWKKPRGFTSAGCFLNEGTALHDSFVKECITRCSYPGSKVFVDTNPENPSHTIKKDYIDNNGQKLPNGRLNIRVFHFTLFDNDTLDEEYIQSIVAATPSGVFTERDIYGRWVSADGVVYPDFKESMYCPMPNDMDIVEYFAGVDWGYGHYGSIVVVGRHRDGRYYLVEEIAKKNRSIKWWVTQAKDIISRFGKITFWCDSARPEHIDAFRDNGIKAELANKNVMDGVEFVGSLMKMDKLRIVEDAVELFKQEIHLYVWNDKTGGVVKVNDDVLDALRYALYNQLKDNPRINVLSGRI